MSLGTHASSARSSRYRHRAGQDFAGSHFLAAALELLRSFRSVSRWRYRDMPIRRGDLLTRGLAGVRDSRRACVDLHADMGLGPAAQAEIEAEEATRFELAFPRPVQNGGFRPNGNRAMGEG